MIGLGTEAAKRIFSAAASRPTEARTQHTELHALKMTAAGNQTTMELSGGLLNDKAIDLVDSQLQIGARHR